jgi:hypothetical protein
MKLTRLIGLGLYAEGRRMANEGFCCDFDSDLRNLRNLRFGGQTGLRNLRGVYKTPGFGGLHFVGQSGWERSHT